MGMGHGPCPWPMAHGPWPVAPDPWTIVHGPWAMAHGPGRLCWAIAVPWPWLGTAQIELN